MAHLREANALKTTQLTTFEKEVIAGCLIGDGSLERSGKYYRLRIGHTVRHSEYVRWKHKLLMRICLSEPQMVPKTASIRLGTIGLPELSAIRQQWYNNGIKIIPMNFRLTPLMLAIWFMDDGCKTGKTVNFSVHNFAVDSIKLLQQKLSEYGIQTAIHSDGKGPRLYVRQASYLGFKELVKPYIHECMAYKLP